MNCQNCNNPIEEGSVFCGNCGQRITPDISAQTQPTVIQKPQNQVTISKKSLKKIIIAVSCVCVLIIAGIIVSIIATSNVSLDNYVNEKIEFSGANGYGSIASTGLSSFIDTESLVSDTQKEIRYKSGNDSLWDMFTEDDYFTIEDYMTVELPENNGQLSNGDVVDIKIKIEKEKIKNDKNITKGIKGGDEVILQYTVDGLPECVIVDVFDAIESFTYFLTNDSSTITLKDGYEKEYENSICVRVEESYSQDYIKIYGNDFNSFTVGINTISDNIREDTKVTKLVIDCDADEYLDKGIILNPVEKEVNVEVVSWIKDGVFTDSDIKALKEKADSKIKELNKGAKFYKSVFYFKEDYYSTDSMLVFYYSDESGVYVAYFKDLYKIASGSVYNIEEQELVYKTDWWSDELYAYDNIADYEGDISFDNKTTVNIPN